MQIWTSTRRRSHHTAWPFLTTAQASKDPASPVSSPILSASAGTRSEATSPTTKTARRPLNVKVIEKPQMAEINPGVWDGLSPDLARKYYPDDWERFVNDPYSYRAPRAESYHDLSG